MKRGYVIPSEFFVKYDIHPSSVIKLQEFVVKLEEIELLFEAGQNMPLQNTIKEIIGDKCYTKHLPNSIMYNSNVVDVGANIGIFSIFMAKYFDCNVYSIEMDKRNYDLLKVNILKNKITEKIKHFNIALSGKSGKVIYQPAYDLVGSKIIEQDSGGGGCNANSVTLSEFINKNNLRIVNLLKLDCEGCEFDILKNIDVRLFDIIENIVIEYHISKKNTKTDLNMIINKLKTHYKIIVEKDPISNDLGFLYCLKTESL